MQQQQFNPPHMSGRTGGDVGPDTHVRVGKSKDKVIVNARAHRKKPNKCSKCEPSSGGWKCRCNGCGMIQPYNNFYFDTNRGHEGTCHECKARANREYLKKKKRETKSIVAKAKVVRKTKTIRKEVKQAARLTTTHSETGLQALLDVSMYSAKLDKRAWKSKLNEQIDEAQAHIAECRVGLAFLDKLK